MTNPYHVRIQRDLAYTTLDSLYKHHCDVYIPISPSSDLVSASSVNWVDAARAFPVVVYFHGGGWIQGDRRTEQTTGVCMAWARQGYTVVAPSYRLSHAVQNQFLWLLVVPILGSVYYIVRNLLASSSSLDAAMPYPWSTLFWILFLIGCIVYLLYLDMTLPMQDDPWPAPIQDAAAALAWTFRTLSPDCCFVAGHSAGAHLATTLAYHSTWLDEAMLAAGGTSTSVNHKIQGVIAISGPYTVQGMIESAGTIGELLMPRVFGTNTQQWDACFPLQYVSSDSPPTLLLNAEFEFGLIHPARQLYDKLNQDNVWTEQHCFQGMNHFSIIRNWDTLQSGVLQIITRFCQAVQDSI